MMTGIDFEGTVEVDFDRRKEFRAKLRELIEEYSPKRRHLWCREYMLSKKQLAKYNEETEAEPER